MPNPDKLDEIVQALQRQTGDRQESDFFKAFEYFVSEDGIRGKTNITAAQRNMIWVFDVWGKRHPDWGLGEAATSLAQLFISEGGESRRGLVELFQRLTHISQPAMGNDPQIPPDLKPRGR